MPEYIKVDEVCSYLLNIANEFDKNDKYYPEKHLGEKAKTLRMLSKKFYGFSGNVEIVRCKECVHFHISQPIQGKEITECTRERYEYDAASVKPDDFCSYGERKETE